MKRACTPGCPPTLPSHFGKVIMYSWLCVTLVSSSFTFPEQSSELVFGIHMPAVPTVFVFVWHRFATAPQGVPQGAPGQEDEGTTTVPDSPLADPQPKTPGHPNLCTETNPQLVSSDSCSLTHTWKRTRIRRSGDLSPSRER